jgi:hypothetical protein
MWQHACVVDSSALLVAEWPLLHYSVRSIPSECWQEVTLHHPGRRYAVTTDAKSWCFIQQQATI